MRNPHLRERLTTTALAVAIIGTAVLALPRGPASDVSTARGQSTAEGGAREDFGRLLQERHPSGSVAEQAAVSPEVAAPRYESPLDPEAIQDAADVASRFAVEFMSWRYDEAPEEREARLAPLLSENARTWLTRGSTGLAELEDRRRRREVATAELAFLEPLEVTARSASFLVALRVIVEDTAGVLTVERTLTVLVRNDESSWAVEQTDV